MKKPLTDLVLTMLIAVALLALVEVATPPARCALRTAAAQGIIQDSDAENIGAIVLDTRVNIGIDTN